METGESEGLGWYSRLNRSKSVDERALVQQVLTEATMRTPRKQGGNHKALRA